MQQKRQIAKKLKDYERHKAKEDVEQKRLLEEKKEERVIRIYYDFSITVSMQL